MRLLRLTGAAALLFGVLWIGRRGVGPLPPLGPLLDPVRGAWGAVATAELPRQASATIPGLGGPVEVRYDARGVPHIFAPREEDAIRALGYVVARDRLFQLDLQARAGAGTLTELLGARALPLDSVPRHLGMARAVERAWAALPADGVTRRYAEAYADGVNAYIATVDAAALPVEYKLLGRQPVPWAPRNVLALAARMAWTLSYGPNERERQLAEGLVGPAAADALFPVVSPVQEPIQPTGRGMATFDTLPIPGPGAPDSQAVALGRLLPRSPTADADGHGSRIFASNNWAVAPSRSRSGKALLAGDPHLELTLPSIWYEAHLVVPGQLDTYGVTIPGSAGMLIGFTRDLAWSLTNTGADVLDFYRETVDDHVRPVRYLVDEQWRDIELREEAYRDPSGRVFRVDTVRFTHRGPMRPLGSDWVSMRWTALEPGDVVEAFALAARQRTAGAFLDSLATRFFVPAQNALVADRSGNIAIRSTGHYPIRPDHGSGLVIRDGSASGSDWLGFWPVSDYPQALNPSQGFLASANQQPIDPAVQGRYLGPDAGYDAWRALQINTLLRADSSVTLDAMRRFQTDPGSVRADLFVPRFLHAARGRRAAGAMSKALTGADSVLTRWDRRYTVDNTGSVLFEQAMREVARRTWDELVPAGDTSRVATPGGTVLLRLMFDSASTWWDDRQTTGRVEQRDDILVASLEAAYDTLVRRYGPPGAGRWAWGERGAANLEHLLRLGGFSRRGLAVQSGPGTLNPSSSSGFGSSWRMVVELGDRVRALGTYPGGQSGNPASARYDDRVRFWQRGDLELLYTPPALDSVAPAQVRAALTLAPSPGAGGSR
ncbi:MAG: penicillin acylase family protein [Gemmatimonadetes bacterium]|nr:penicillin acylase family protein [Gemmatimonadota bacterium]